MLLLTGIYSVDLIEIIEAWASEWDFTAPDWTEHSDYIGPVGSFFLETTLIIS